MIIGPAATITHSTSPLKKRVKLLNCRIKHKIWSENGFSDKWHEIGKNLAELWTHLYQLMSFLFPCYTVPLQQLIMVYGLLIWLPLCKYLLTFIHFLLFNVFMIIYFSIVLNCSTLHNVLLFAFFEYFYSFFSNDFCITNHEVVTILICVQIFDFKKMCIGAFKKKNVCIFKQPRNANLIRKSSKEIEKNIYPFYKWQIQSYNRLLLFNRNVFYYL